MKFNGGGLKMTRKRSIMVVLYAIYIAFILVSAVPYLAQERGEKVGDNFEYNIVIDSGEEVPHYFDVVRADDTQPGTLDLTYYPSTHTLEVDSTNIKELRMDCKSFYADEAAFVLGTSYADDTNYYKDWFIAGGDNNIDPFTVNVITDTAMTKVVFEGVPLPQKVEVGSTDWWAAGTKYSVSNDDVTVTEVPEGSTTVKIYFKAPDNNDPVADFVFDPSSPKVDQQVSFDASGSSDPDDDTLTYTWNFGDGSTEGSGETTTHTYDTAGPYTVTLKVSDGKGGLDTQDEGLTVLTEDAGEPPVADFTAPTKGTVGKDVSFDASGTTDSDGTISTYSWDFDDGKTGTGITVKHKYTKADTYTVELTVTDNDGMEDTKTKSITISAAEEDDDDEDEDEGMLGLGKVAGIDLFLILIIIIILVVVIIAGAGAARSKKKKKALAEEAAAQQQQPPEPPPEGEGMPPAAPPPMYPEEQMAAPPPMAQYEEGMPPEEPLPEEGLPPEEELPLEEEPLPEEELPLEEEVPPAPEDEVAAPPEEGEVVEEAPAEEEQPSAEEEAPSEEEEAAEQPEEGGEMTSCPACGTSIKIGTLVCPNCNSEFEW